MRSKSIPAKSGSALRPDPCLLLTLVISFIAALPLVGPYFVGSHDGILAVYRFFQFDRSIQDSILLPRWAPDLFFGYGYPFFNFYAPLSYYVAEGLHVVGLGFVGSISGTFALGFVLSGLFMYLFIRDIGGPWAGALAALAYVFAPYHLVNAHLRGDLAEFFAFVWFPAILWAAGRLVSRGGLGYLGLTALLYGALLTTHNIMALAFSPLLAGYLGFLLVGRYRKSRSADSTHTPGEKQSGGTPPKPPGLAALRLLGRYKKSDSTESTQPHPTPGEVKSGGTPPEPPGLAALRLLGRYKSHPADGTQPPGEEQSGGTPPKPPGLPPPRSEGSGEALPEPDLLSAPAPRVEGSGSSQERSSLPGISRSPAENPEKPSLAPISERGFDPEFGEMALPGRTSSGGGEVGRRAFYALLAIMLAFGLSAFFWVPALLQVDDIQIGRLANDPSFYYRTSLMQWSGYVSHAILQDYGPRSAAGDYGYPVELGLIQTLIAAVAAGLLAWRRISSRSSGHIGDDAPPRGAPASRRPRWRASNPSVGEAHEPPLQMATRPAYTHVGNGEKEGLGPLLFLAAAALVYYAIMFPWALVLWEKVPLMSYLQSPWRLLPFLTLSTAALTGYLGWWASRLRPGWNTATLALLALLATAPNLVHLQPRYVDLREDEISVPGSLRFELLSQNLGMTAAGEYLPKGVRSKMAASPVALDALSNGKPPSSFDSGLLAEGAEAEVLETRTTTVRFSVQSPQGTPFVFNQTYFPGWTAYLDGQELPLKGIGTANLMGVQVPPGPHRLEFRFQDTRARLVGQALSLASLAALLLLLLALIRQRLIARPAPINEAQPRTTAHNRAQAGTSKRNQAQLSAIKPYQAQALVPLALVLVVLAAIFALQRPSLPPAAEASRPVEAAWLGGPALQGYDLNPPSLKPGEEIAITLYWKDLTPSQEVRTGLKGRTGKVWGQATSVQGVSTDGPQQKEVRQINVPADIPPGMYQITLEVLDGAEPLPLVQESLARPIFPEKTLLLGPVFVDRGEPVKEGQITASTRREVNLENQASLLGYDLTRGARSIDLITYWQALSVMREDYSIFAHLLDMGEKVLVYKDLQPEGNPYPTTLWRPGEVVTVPFHFDLPADFTPENHRIALGFYTPDNFQRLSVLDPTGQPVTNTIFLSLAPPSGT